MSISGSELFNLAQAVHEVGPMPFPPDEENRLAQLVLCGMQGKDVDLDNNDLQIIFAVLNEQETVRARACGQH